MSTAAIAEIFGWIGGTAGTMLLWPQVWRLWVQRQHSGLSLTANVIGVLYYSGWAYYGVSQQSVAVIATNCAALLAMAAVLAGQMWLARPHLRQWLPTLLAGYGVLATLALTLGAITVGSIVGLGAVVSVGTQVVSLIRQRRGGNFDFSGVARLRWWLGVFCNAMWIIYGVLKTDPVMILPSTANVILSTAVLMLTLPRKQPAVAAG
ncbi:SemiSWEET family transporter [Catelliglobosispora koreensis]|uniref:SemiSWEET family transporter n=1 Tax=Catelliglobosispora koreensis TaxID=129052 RepID=UPI00036FBC5F|nr:SemiSWEET family transporter [Catelliglobosispora koreensis]